MGALLIVGVGIGAVVLSVIGVYAISNAINEWTDLF